MKNRLHSEGGLLGGGISKVENNCGFGQLYARVLQETCESPNFEPPEDLLDEGIGCCGPSDATDECPGMPDAVDNTGEDPEGASDPDAVPEEDLGDASGSDVDSRQIRETLKSRAL